MKYQYMSPASLRLSSVDNEYGAAIGAVVLWVIGAVFGWLVTQPKMLKSEGGYLVTKKIYFVARESDLFTKGQGAISLPFLNSDAM